MTVRSGWRVTSRQLEILTLASEGWTGPQIAGLLGIAEQTVRNHLVNAYDVLGVESMVHAFHALGWLGPSASWSVTDGWSIQ
jgi:DNA-binding NarL/FixJ family response regulator